ncbi:MAG: hypothetical protein HOC79_08915 [Euryarchaeota archaeon]|nr:hypothetical protein [Euryarchaeota archaeon]
MAKSKKAELIAQLKESGITIPPKATVKELKALLPVSSEKGWLFRLAKPTSRIVDKDHPIHNCIMSEIYWIPDCPAAQAIIRTQLVFVMQRATESPKMAKSLSSLVGWVNGN